MNRSSLDLELPILRRGDRAGTTRPGGRSPHGGHTPMGSAEAVRRYVAHLHRRNYRPNTIRNRITILNRFQAHLRRRSLLRATATDIAAFIDRLDNPRSRAAELTPLRSFYRWAAAEDIIARDATVGVELPRLQRYYPRPISDTDLAKSLVDPPERVRPWLYLGAWAGLRACEISQLRAEAVVRSHDMLVIEHSKGGKARSLPLHPLVGQHLAGLPRDGWLFPRRDGQPGPTPPHLVSMLVNQYLHDIGITATFHQYRHWFGTNAQAVSGDLRATQDLMGHESIVSTQGYTWVSPGRLAGIVGALPVFDVA